MHPKYLGKKGWAWLVPPRTDNSGFTELPEKQEQLSAIYAVLDHLPEANHTSLERLIFHLVKQVPLPQELRGLGPRASCMSWPLVPGDPGIGVREGCHLIVDSAEWPC